MILRIQSLICALLLFGVAPAVQAQDVSSLTARAAAILEGASAGGNEVQTLLTALMQAQEAEADCMAALLLRDIRRDTAQAQPLLLRAAQNGSPRAQWELGNMLLEGKGTAQNRATSLPFPIWGNATLTDTASRRTRSKQRAFFASPPIRATLLPPTIWANATETASALRRTPPKPCAGTASAHGTATARPGSIWPMPL